MAKKDSYYNHPAVNEAIKQLDEIQNPAPDDFRQAVLHATAGIKRGRALEGPPMRSSSAKRETARPGRSSWAKASAARFKTAAWAWTTWPKRSVK